MITSDFTGNLGNHLFQYVVTRAVAESKGYEWGFTKHIYGDYFGGKSQMNFLDIDYGKQPVVGIEQEYKEKIVNLGGHTNVHLYDTFDELKDNSKLVGCWQTEQYFEKEKVKEWLKLKQEDEKAFQSITSNILDNNTCVINVRGGEYRNISSVLLPHSYWNRAIDFVKNTYDNVKFIVISDDVQYAQFIFPNFPCFHYSIELDYYIINKARYLILSNSSFAWFPTWLNEKAEIVIVPKYWARFNVSDGYWANSNIFTKGWTYFNREGGLQNYASIVDELKNSSYAHLYNLE